MKSKLRYFLFVFMLFTIVILANGNTTVNARLLYNDNGNVVEPLKDDISGTMQLAMGTYSSPAYGKGYPRVTDFPFPFNKVNLEESTGTHTLYAGRVESNGKYYLLYCVGYGMNLSTQNTNIPQVDQVDSNGSELTDEIKDLISLVYIYGFDTPSAADSFKGSGPIDLWNTYGYIRGNAGAIWATQVASWLASSGVWDNTALRDQIGSFFVDDPNDSEGRARNAYDIIVENVDNARKDLSFTSKTPESASTVELKWNNETKRFESDVLTDTNNMFAAERVAITFETGNSNLEVINIGSNQYKIVSTENIGSKESPITISAKKVINNGVGKIRLWQKISDPDNIQPLARLVPEEREPSYTYIKVYTSGLKFRVQKTLKLIDGNKGDATVEGAVYGLYSDEQCTQLVEELTVNANGYSQKSSFLPYKDYWMKEIKESVGTKKNDKVYHVDPSTAQIDEDGYLCVTVAAENEIIPTELHIIKYKDDPDSTTNSPAKGAVLRLTLKSNKEETYTAVVDSTGLCKFENIPYGLYTISEDDTNDNKYLEIDPIDIMMDTSSEKYTYRLIIPDEMFMTYLRVIKYDKDTKEVIELAGAKFKIYDCDNKEWVKLLDTDSNQMITEFVTNDQGFFITPQKLKAGKYVVYETEAPDGYYLDPKYTVPENEADLGDVTKGGIEVNLYKTVEVDKLEDGSLVHTLKVEDEPLMTQIEVIKKGEMFTDVNTIQSEYGNMKQPVYTEKVLGGVEYQIIAKYPIMSADGKHELVAQGKVVDTIVTNDEGKAVSIPLYNGTYEIKETVTPLGFITDTNIPDIVLNNQDQNQKIQTTVKELSNKRQPVEFKFYKEFEESKYVVSADDEKYAVFGIYANEDIKNYNQTKVLINKDNLIDVVKVEADGQVVSSVDLPDGKYYYQEIETGGIYELDEEKHTFEVKHENTTDPKCEILGEDIVNTPETANMILLKLSSSSFIDENEGLYGTNGVDPEIVAERSRILLEDIASMSKEEMLEYLDENSEDFITIKNAEYGVYLDEQCQEPLQIKNDDGTTSDVRIVSDENGLFELNELPLGVYFLKETKAPATHELAQEIVRMEITPLDTEAERAYRVLINDSLGLTFEKTDIFTGDKVKDCKFIITDENQEEIASFTTNEKGIAEIPIDMFEQGETYYYQEIEAPDIYKEDGRLYTLNTEPHKFVMDYTIDYENEELIWNEDDKEEVENYRPVIEELIVKKTDEETGEPLQGCKFSIVLLGENGEPYVNEAGETVYLVKDAVTDENGEYRVEKPVYGTYKFIEVEAPEGYDLAEQEMEGYEFTINDETPDTLIFEVTNTGDIAVVAIAVVAVVCIAGIVFVVLRNKKLNKNV